MLTNILILKLFFGFIISFLVTFYLVPLIINVAFKLNVLDNPDGSLKVHKKATPYLGGLAVYIGFITSLALVFPFENRMFLFLLGSTLLMFVGLIDDLVVMQPHQKFFGQIIAAFCFLKAGFYLKEIFFNKISNIFISFFWILSVINAFNLIDIMDGQATLVASMASISFIILAIIFQSYNTALLLSAFLGSLIAFWWFNKPDAKIYLGDSGSLFIGGLLATVPFTIPWGIFNVYGLITPVIILLIPLLELGTLILIRTYKGIPFYKGSPDHFSIYLQKNGWNKNEILGYLAIYACFLFLMSYLFVLNKIDLISSIIYLSSLIILWYFALFKRIFLKNFTL
ncbi:undecaprenyl/decaprenyl-phosphate alpha-N-acetylglucosaminyl 1-phosphate transferase [Candidatus Dependentiae bacterium]|nr:undecaprenyl/decaprenyl-phosphate alpha-N-acetylglucosaminyl 1-phosphate transferase [Candidatus Dependentiae bacterium]